MTERQLNYMRRKLCFDDPAKKWNENRQWAIDKYGTEAVITYVDAALLRRHAIDMPLQQDNPELALVERIYGFLKEQYNGNHGRMIKAIVKGKDDDGDPIYAYPSWQSKQMLEWIAEERQDN